MVPRLVEVELCRPAGAVQRFHAPPGIDPVEALGLYVLGQEKELGEAELVAVLKLGSRPVGQRGCLRFQQAPHCPH